MTTFAPRSHFPQTHRVGNPTNLRGYSRVVEVSAANVHNGERPQ